MQTETLFDSQLLEAVRKYPNLKIVKDEQGFSFLKGIIDIPNDNEEIVGHFLIEIHRSEKFPFRFPLLYETGGEIPNEPDWHKNGDKTCCITVWPDEIIKCKNGITVSNFIERHTIPYLAHQLYRKITGQYKDEYAHERAGLFQFYETLMKTNDTNLWIQYFKNTFRGLSTSCGRNNKCFCGSKVKFKYCHLEVFNTLHLLGEKQVINDLRILI